MSTVELTRDIQRIAGVAPDGIWGPESARAVLAKLRSQTSDVSDQQPPSDLRPPTSDFLATVDDRSRLNINTLQTWVRPVAARFLDKCLAAGILVKITSGWRTDAEQERLYAQGRSAPGKIVTNARAGYSNHNYGLAFDITLFDDESGKPVYESPLYTSAGAIGKKLGLAWGGDWTSGDEPHFELRPAWAKTLSEAEMLTVLRQRKARGESYV